MTKKSEQEIVKEIMSESKCGHINRHSRTDGKPDNLACMKDKGHDGNHGAEHNEWRESEFGERQIGKKRYTHVKVWCEWGEMAGTPPENIIPEKLVPKPADTERAEWIKNMVGGLIPPGTQIG